MNEHLSDIVTTIVNEAERWGSWKVTVERDCDSDNITFRIESRHFIERSETTKKEILLSHIWDYRTLVQCHDWKFAVRYEVERLNRKLQNKLEHYYSS